MLDLPIDITGGEEGSDGVFLILYCSGLVHN